MPKIDTNTVNKKIFLIKLMVLITSIAGIVVIVEVARGVRFHESNIRHLGLTSSLNAELRDFSQNSGGDTAELRRLLGDIRLVPETCLRSKKIILHNVLRVLGTDGIFTICETELAHIDEAMALLAEYESARTPRAEFAARMRDIGAALHGHSFSVRPLVSYTVDVLLIIACAILVVKALAVIIVTLSSSKSIIAQFNRLTEVQDQLAVQNQALETAVTTLEQQKQNIVDAQKSAEYSAMHDPLAGLPNRRFFDKALTEWIAQQRKIGVLLIDIDHFKSINDTYGHLCGDKVICEVARRLRALISAEDFIARIGGDEFVVMTDLAADVSPNRQAQQLAERIVAALSEPLHHNGVDCRLSASIGVATCLNAEAVGAGPGASLLVQADLALYRAKLNGRNGYALYDRALHAEVTAKNKITDEIHRALENAEFVPFYQPQMIAHSLELSGVEALARWRHPERGLLMPDEFIPIADELGLTARIDQMIFEGALKDFERWQKLGLGVPRFSVNVSYKRLLNPDLITQLKAYRLGQGVVTFEILESTFMDNADGELRLTLRALTDIGIDLELDDFGSGHASILALLALKPTRFKIDRNLVANITASASQRALVKSIIDIGKSQNLEVIAEGVSSAEHLEILRELDCDIVQGHFFSKPISCDAFMEFVSDKEWQAADQLRLASPGEGKIAS